MAQLKLTKLYVETALRANQYSKKASEVLRDALSRRELRTIRIQGPRQSGHSTAAVELMTHGGILFTVTDVAVDQLRIMAGNKDPHLRFRVFDANSKVDGRGMTFTMIIVDNASRVPPAAMGRIFDLDQGHTFFVLLG